MVQPIQDVINRVINKYSLESMTKAAGKARILSVAWDNTVKEVYEKKSLKYYSIRDAEWSLPDHVTDKEFSTVLCNFRT